MRILVIGSGGREHALCWKLAQEAEVHCCPGNPGIEQVATCHNVSVNDHDAVAELAKSIQPDLVLIGPENPLVDGLADRLRSDGLNVFGPNAHGAQLEGSKAFSKELMLAAGVPTAHSYTTSDPAEALGLAKTELMRGAWVVIKASGLAFGKGSVICGTPEEVEETIDIMMVKREFGDSGATVVIEQFLKGREFSLLTLVSGTNYFSLPVAQDYKRIFDGNLGPNTGGMGSYSPVDWVSQDLIRKTEQQVVEPILRALADRHTDYRGVLFSGLMADGDDVRCIEYNVRFGDPEIQSIVPRLGSGFAEALLACAKGLPIPPIEVLNNTAVTVVLASGGYPGPVQKGILIDIDRGIGSDLQFFHAGTAMHGDQLVTEGGRVLAVTAVASSVEEARKKAYEAVERVKFEGRQFRSDIGA